MWYWIWGGGIAGVLFKIWRYRIFNTAILLKESSSLVLVCAICLPWLFQRWEVGQCWVVFIAFISCQMSGDILSHSAQFLKYKLKTLKR